MQQFIITNGTIMIGETTYNVEKINPQILIKSCKKTTNNAIKVANTKGVYIFVAKKDIQNFNINLFNKEVTGIFLINNTLCTKIIGVPPYNNNLPKKDCIFYVGSAEQVVNRIKEHWNNDSINGCISLKLGFESRKWIKKHLDVYVIDLINNINLDHKNLEKEIRNHYGSSFGK